MFIQFQKFGFKKILPSTYVAMLIIATIMSVFGVGDSPPSFPFGSLPIVVWVLFFTSYPGFVVSSRIENGGDILNIAVTILVTIVVYFFVGLIIDLLLSIFFKKNK